MPKKIAIVGSGCAGLGAAWALKDVDCTIDLFEQDDRLGGHTNTVSFRSGEYTIPVDTGFIVMNTATYPNFIRFLEAVGVGTVPTAMTFGVSRDHGLFEWSGELKGIFAQWRNFFRPCHYRMIFDIIRFNMFAPDVLDDPKYAEATIGEYLDEHRYSTAFRQDYLIPMTAAVWSTSDKASLKFPAQTLIRFLWNHHLLSTVSKRPDWLTIPGGSQKYIAAIVQELGPKLNVHLRCEVQGISRPSSRSKSKVTLYWEEFSRKSPQIVRESEQRLYDAVIFACHGNVILDMLDRLNNRTSTPSIEEEEIFSAFDVSWNTCYLHSDTSLMPTRKQTWSSWNYLVNSTPKPGQREGVSLTYNMNILQHIPQRIYGDVLVTMNPDHPPKEELTQGKFDYDHPLYTLDAIRAQERLEKIQGDRGAYYCGAWTKYGFHEDGFSSGLKAGMALGGKLPFKFVDSTRSRATPASRSWPDRAVRAVLSTIAVIIDLVEIILGLPGISWMVGLLSTLGEIALDGLESVGVLR